MIFNDPTLYGATLPQREIPVNAPFVNPYLAQWQSFPLQNVPLQNMQWQNFQKFVPQAHGMIPTLPQGYGVIPPVPQGHGMIPPVPQSYGMIPPAPQSYGMIPPAPQGHGMIPPAPQSYGMIPHLTQGCGVTQPFYAASVPTAFNPYLQGSFYNSSLPFYGWQRPLSY